MAEVKIDNGLAVSPQQWFVGVEQYTVEHVHGRLGGGGQHTICYNMQS